MENKKLRRIPQKGWLGGVCAGFAYYFGFPAWVIRAGWALSILFMGFGFWFYILLWIFMPVISETPSDYAQRVDED